MRILCVGLTVWDISIKPVNERSLEQDTSTAEFIKLNGGGDAYNVAVNLAALGINAALLSKVGEDELGAFLIQSAQESGVDVSLLKRIPLPTSASAVLIRESGERSFISYKGACHALSEKDIPNDVLSCYGLLYVGSAFDLPSLDGDGMARLFARAKKLGLVTALDTTAEPCRSDMATFANVLKNVDLFMPSEREAVALTGECATDKAADIFHTCGPKTVVIKLGARGCLLSKDGGKTILPPYNAKIVDSTGAGDAFVAGFLAALSRGMPLSDCARIGNAAGAVCVSRVGASGTIKSFKELLERIKQ